MAPGRLEELNEDRSLNGNRVKIAMAALLGAAIWIASPFITGRREPWDAPGPYYALTLFGAGALMGLWEPQRPWRWVVAIYAGQCLAVLALTALRGDDLGLFFPMGMVVLAFFTVLSLLGAAGGAWLRRSRSG